MSTVFFLITLGIGLPIFLIFSENQLLVSLISFFLCGPFLQSLLNLLQYCLFYVLAFWPQGIWDLSSLTRDWTCTPCTGRRRFNHWTTREVPSFIDFSLTCFLCSSLILVCIFIIYFHSFFKIFLLFLVF